MRQVLEYRQVELAMGLIRQGPQGYKQFTERPDLQRALLEVMRHRAPEMTHRQMMAAMEGQAAENAPEPEDHSGSGMTEA